MVQLRYRFDPGNEDDGVSALVPLHVLNQLPEEPFAWLVPGLFDEKVEALVRALPKKLRVNFVPVPACRGASDAAAGSSAAARCTRSWPNALCATGGVPRAARCLPRGPCCRRICA